MTKIIIDPGYSAVMNIVIDRQSCDFGRLLKFLEKSFNITHIDISDEGFIVNATFRNFSEYTLFFDVMESFNIKEVSEHILDDAKEDAEAFDDIFTGHGDDANAKL